MRALLKLIPLISLAFGLTGCIYIDRHTYHERGDCEPQYHEHCEYHHHY